MSSGFHITDDSLIRNCRLIAKEAPEAIAEGLYEELHEVEEPEVVKRTPFETGKLRRTIKTRPPEIHGKHVECAITAGGEEAPYAPYVHEDMTAHHPIGQAKFLQSVLLESRPFLAARVGKRIRLKR